MELVEQRLQEAGYQIPEVAKPLASYVPAVRSGDLIFTSGQLPSAAGVVKTGRLGAGIGVEEGAEAARICILNCLAAVKSLAGSLDNVAEVVKVTGFVNSTPDFIQQPQVLNGASDFLTMAFKDAGTHCRSAVGVSSLPLGACVEVELIVRVK